MSGNKINFRQIDLKSSEDKKSELLKNIADKINYGFGGQKIYIGNLSPGCLFCVYGYWSCIFINNLCNKSCFYCPQDKKNNNSIPSAGGVKFFTPDSYANYLKELNFKAVGFSGGEPFLSFKKLVSYINKIRERLGEKIYIWVYTNGSVISKNKLKELKKTINEIRFNISATNYDLYPVKLGVNLIRNVSIEIPAIPEDYEIVKNLLKKIKKTGVKYLNVHQLFATKYNYKNYLHRNYTLDYLNSVFESEITALKLIRFAINNNIALSINYCSSSYKHNFQNMRMRQRIAPLVKRDFEELTSIGYIRRLSIGGPALGIKKIIKTLRHKDDGVRSWPLNTSKKKVFLCSGLLRTGNFKGCHCNISYFVPILKTKFNPKEKNKEILLGEKNRLFIRRKLVIQKRRLSVNTVRSFLNNVIGWKRKKIIPTDKKDSLIGLRKLEYL